MPSNNPDRDPLLQRFIEGAITQISVPPRTAVQSRRVALMPIVGGTLAAVIVIAGALVIGRILYETRSGVAARSGQPTSTPVQSASPARDPGTLPQLPWEAPVLDAFRAGGLSVRTIGGSVEEGALGVPLPARAFIVTPGPFSGGGFGTGADVIFVKDAAIGMIEVCEVPGAAGRFSYVIYVGGHRVSSADAVAPVYYLVSSDYYVVAYDVATRDALRSGLGAAPATCLQPR